jgi:hypothetical protein
MDTIDRMLMQFKQDGDNNNSISQESQDSNISEVSNEVGSFGQLHA